MAAVEAAIRPPAQSSRAGSALQFAARSLQGLTWGRFGMLIAFCAIYGALLSINPETGGAPQLVAAYLVGVIAALTYFSPVFLVVTVAASFAPRHPVARAGVLGLTAVVGLAIGYYVMQGVTDLLIGWQVAPVGHASPVPLVVTSWLGLAIYLLQERDQTAAQAVHEELEYQVNLDRRMSEAQLQLLQSQIEPHFLFNALAHVRRLYRIEPRAGRTMIRHLSRYLGAALPALRETSIGLGHDLELAITYLNIQQIRMGQRLAFDVDVSEEARQARVPPMMITTLVENAIKHGLSALPEGGSVRIAARANGHLLSIQVSDTGQGFQENLGTGVGLANIRARLAILYGTNAQLLLSQNVPRGVTATIVIPLHRGPH